MRHAALMLLGGGGAAGIFSDDQVKTQLPGIAGGGFDADVGGDAAENNGVDPAAAQLKLKVGAIERAPLAFGHFDIALLLTQRGRVGPPVFGQRMRPGLSVDRLFQRFGEIGRPAHADHDDRRTLLPALVCQASGARHHLVSPMRAAGERQNAFLQIDYHQRRVFCIEF